MNALVAGNGSYIVRPCGSDLHSLTPSTYPEENGLKMEYEEIGSPLFFTQKEKEEEKEEQKQVPMEINQPFKPLNIMDIGISDEEDSDQDPVIISDTPKEDVKKQKQI